jgi:hypothetical protein
MPTLAEKRAAKKKRDAKKAGDLAKRRAKRASHSKSPEMQRPNELGVAKHTTYSTSRR